MTVPTSQTVETGHADMIVSTALPSFATALKLNPLAPPSPQHDAQLDYYGRRLATASSDRTIRLFDVEGESDYRLVETLRG